MEYFNIEPTQASDILFFPCPIHSGDNPTGLTIFLEEKYGFVGNWKCWTNGCHEQYGSSIIGFLKALLKKSYKDTEKWVHQFLNLTPDKLIPPNEGQRTFNRLTNILLPPAERRKNWQGRK